MSDRLREALSGSPALFPFQMNPIGNAVQFLRLSQSDFEAASFLDQRILRADIPQGVIPWNELVEAARNLPLRCHFIFHISHAGSTLLSRLIGTHQRVFSLREPAILRSLVQKQFADRLDVFLGLLSRTFHPDQHAIIKATSFVSEIAPTLLDLVPKSRAMLMYVPPWTFLAALLDGSMSDIHDLAQSRLQRIQKRGVLNDLSIDVLSPGERVAMSWLAEMLALADAAAEFPDRTLWLDFDSFLANQEQRLTQVFAHFGLEADVTSLLNGPLPQRYAKKPEVLYDSNFRTKLLKQAQTTFAGEIARGLEWLARPEVFEIVDLIEETQLGIEQERDPK